MPLLDDEALERSSVVANCRMNRERTLLGSNGYGRELGFDPLDFLAGRVAEAGQAAWLDLCCGSARALVEAHRLAAERGWGASLTIVGVDLVGMFAAPDPAPDGLRLVAAPVRSWAADRPFDLVTCVHGLHYLGDKLGLIEKFGAWLTHGGRFAGNLAADGVRLTTADGRSRPLARDLRRAGWRYDARRRLLTATGPIAARLPYRYLGADDSVGPNYTGQPAVASHYEWVAGGASRPAGAGWRDFRPSLE